MSLGSEPFYLKQHYKDQLAYLERDSNEGSNIQNVWVYNFEHELAKIAELLKTYTYVAMVSSKSSFISFLLKIARSLFSLQINNLKLSIFFRTQNFLVS